jgi:hypothetical protein
MHLRGSYTPPSNVLAFVFMIASAFAAAQSVQPGAPTVTGDAGPSFDKPPQGAATNCTEDGLQTLFLSNPIPFIAPPDPLHLLPLRRTHMNDRGDRDFLAVVFNESSGSALLV